MAACRAAAGALATERANVDAAMSAASHCRILILDFGAQYTQLIARRLRETNVYCEIHPHDVAIVKEAPNYRSE